MTMISNSKAQECLFERVYDISEICHKKSRATEIVPCLLANIISNCLLQSQDFEHQLLNATYIAGIVPLRQLYHSK